MLLHHNSCPWPLANALPLPWNLECFHLTTVPGYSTPPASSLQRISRHFSETMPWCLTKHQGMISDEIITYVQHSLQSFDSGRHKCDSICIPKKISDILPHLDNSFSRSSMYTLNRQGDSTLPCRTPFLTETGLETLSLHLTCISWAVYQFARNFTK